MGIAVVLRDGLFSVANESGNDGTWLTVFGFRTNSDARILIDEFSRLGVIEKHVVRLDRPRLSLICGFRSSMNRIHSISSLQHGSKLNVLWGNTAMCSGKS